jgi:thioredoxin reductase
MRVVSLDGGVNGLTAVTCRSPRGGVSFDVQHLFLFTGANPNTEWLKGCNRTIDDKGFIVTGSAVHDGYEDVDLTLETSVTGVFAIGDVRSGSPGASRRPSARAPLSSGRFTACCASASGGRVALRPRAVSRVVVFGVEVVESTRAQTSSFFANSPQIR